MKPWKLTVKGTITYHDSFIEAVDAINYDEPLMKDDIELILVARGGSQIMPMACPSESVLDLARLWGCGS